MTSIIHVGAIGAVMGLLAACSTGPELQTADKLDPEIPPEWAAEQITAYEQCLEDSMAQATAWEIIQQQCKDSVEANPEILQTD